MAQKTFKDPEYFKDYIRTEQFGICHKDQLRKGLDYGAIKSTGTMHEPYGFVILYSPTNRFIKYESWYASVRKARGSTYWYKELKSFRAIDAYIELTGDKSKIPDEYIKELETGIKS